MGADGQKPDSAELMLGFGTAASEARPTGQWSSATQRSSNDRSTDDGVRAEITEENEDNVKQDPLGLNKSEYGLSSHALLKTRAFIFGRWWKIPSRGGQRTLLLCDKPKPRSLCSSTHG